MSMPLWGALIILTLCVVTLFLSAGKFFDLIVSDYVERHPIKSLFVLPALLLLIVLSVWLGWAAITFNYRYGGM